MESVPDPALRGIVPPIVTPFRPDERIDYSAWQRLIDALIPTGIDGLFVCGSTGEFHALDLEERTVALRFCRQAAAARVKVYGNVGCATTRDTVRLAIAAQDEGIDVLAVVTPYYARISQDEMFEHYSEVCRSVRLPVVAYNYPQHGGSEVLPETVGRIAAANENFVGIKDASGNLDQTVAYRTCAPGRELAVFIGPESILAAGLQAGCAGAVTGSMNIAPKLFVDTYKAVRAGNLDEAARLQVLANELADAMALHSYPGATKEAMPLIGLPTGPCRKPIGPMPPDAHAKLVRTIDHLRAEGFIPVVSQRRSV